MCLEVVAYNQSSFVPKMDLGSLGCLSHVLGVSAVGGELPQLAVGAWLGEVSGGNADGNF